MKHNLLKSLIISVILLMGVSNAWGNVVGVTYTNDNNYSLKLNVHRSDVNNDWVKPDMTATAMEFEGKKLYQASFGYSQYDNGTG